MICPLPRANEMSAFQGKAGRGIGGKETAHAVCWPRRGAGHLMVNINDDRSAAFEESVNDRLGEEPNAAERIRIMREEQVM